MYIFMCFRYYLYVFVIYSLLSLFFWLLSKNLMSVNFRLLTVIYWQYKWVWLLSKVVWNVCHCYQMFYVIPSVVIIFSLAFRPLRETKKSICHCCMEKWWFTWLAIQTNIVGNCKNSQSDHHNRREIGWSVWFEMYGYMVFKSI